MTRRLTDALCITAGGVLGVGFTVFLLAYGGALAVADRWGRFPLYAASGFTVAVVVSFVNSFRYIPGATLGRTLIVDGSMLLFLPLLCLIFALWRERWSVK